MNFRTAQANSLERRRAATLAYALKVAPVIQALQDEGKTAPQIATALNEKGVKCEKGGRWRAEQVHRVLALAADANEKA